MLKNKQFSKIYQALWYNCGSSNFSERLNYKECSILSEYAKPVLSLAGAEYFPRVNRYSALTEELRKALSSHMRIYIIGLEIDACILSTSFALFDEGFQFHILEDCVSTKSEDLADAAKKIIRRNMGTGCLIQSDSIWK